MPDPLLIVSGLCGLGVLVLYAWSLVDRFRTRLLLRDWFPDEQDDR